MSKSTPLRVTTPTTIVIFGVTGDLSQRKLLPALFDLFVKDMLPTTFRLVGFSRRQWSQADFHRFVKKAIMHKRHHHSPASINRFIKNTLYQQGLLDELASYRQLMTVVGQLDEQLGSCANKLLYLAVPPNLYGTIFDQIKKSGLSIPCVGPDGGWTRILVEKPFGRDITTAQQLDQKLGRLFTEDQIFRIDHYLAKETLQNILTFRFSNSLFEPIWNKDHIEKVHIKFFERHGVLGRGAFYDDVGALRDVGQNHMLQMLGAVAMEDPGDMSSTSIRKKRTDILKSLNPIKAKDLKTATRRGQYKGFTKEKEVGALSTTETYFRLMVTLASRRWRGVPFILESGKKMKETVNEISVYFKKTDSNLMYPPGSQNRCQNVLTFRIQPDEGIAIQFWAKKPGLLMELEPRTLSFRYRDSLSDSMIPDAYEQVLFDCIRGDQTRFLTTAEVVASWQFITPILRNWTTSPLRTYPAGSWGPADTKR